MTLLRGVLAAFKWMLQWSIAATLAAVGVAHLFERVASFFT